MTGRNADEADAAGAVDGGLWESRWQAARRRRRGAVDRVVSTLFGVIAIAAIAYVFGLARVVAPHLVD